MDTSIHVYVANVMSHRVVTIEPEATVAQAASKMRENEVDALIVVEDNKPIGIITERDLVYRVLAEQRDLSTKVREVMTKGLITIKTHTTLGEAARLMLDHGIRHLPVTDEEGNLVGMLSMRDIVRAVWG